MDSSNPENNNREVCALIVSRNTDGQSNSIVESDDKIKEVSTLEPIQAPFSLSIDVKIKIRINFINLTAMNF